RADVRGRGHVLHRVRRWGGRQGRGQLLRRASADCAARRSVTRARRGQGRVCLDAPQALVRLELGDLRVAVGDAAARPALGGLDEAAAELVELVLVVRQLVGRDLDPDLVDRGLALLADLVALLGDDRDLADL